MVVWMAGSMAAPMVALIGDLKVDSMVNAWDRTTVGLTVAYLVEMLAGSMVALMGGLSVALMVE